METVKVRESVEHYAGTSFFWPDHKGNCRQKSLTVAGGGMVLPSQIGMPSKRIRKNSAIAIASYEDIFSDTLSSEMTELFKQFNVTMAYNFRATSKAEPWKRC